MDSGSCGKKSHLANNLFKTCFRSKDVALFFFETRLGATRIRKWSIAL